MSTTKFIIICILSVALTLLSWDRTLIYRDEVSLWEDTARKSSSKPRALNNYGHGLKEAFRMEEAAHQFELAIALQPDYADALNNLATICSSINRRSEILGLLQRALAADPNHLAARFNLAMFYYETGHPEEALNEYMSILDQQPFSRESAFSQTMVRLIQKQLSEQHTGRPQ
jgi:tetratricopeptide (TPR) repeat protein